MMMDLNAKSADLGMIVETRDSAHADEIRRALIEAGFVLRASQTSEQTPGARRGFAASGAERHA